MAAKKKTTPPAASGDFDSLVSSIVHIHRQTQNFAAKAVNVSLTLRNWLIGYRIVEFEQRGKDRAAYGESLMDTLALRLASHGLTRVTPRELRRYRQLYQVYPRIWESVNPKSLAQEGFGTLLSLLPPSPIPIRESVSPESQIVESATPQLIHRLSFLLLCTRKNNALVEFALGDLSSQVFVSRYAVELPGKEEMERFIAQISKEVAE